MHIAVIHKHETGVPYESKLQGIAATNHILWDLATKGSPFRTTAKQVRRHVWCLRLANHLSHYMLSNCERGNTKRSDPVSLCASRCPTTPSTGLGVWGDTHLHGNSLEQWASGPHLVLSPQVAGLKGNHREVRFFLISSNCQREKEKEGKR